MTSFRDRSFASIGQNFADGRWHKLEVNVTSGRVVIAVDDFQTVLSPPRGLQSLANLENALYIGSMLSQFSDLQLALREFVTFSGCARGVTINGHSVTFDAAQKGGFPLPTAGCKKDENCRPTSCANSGTCEATWSGFECQCLSDFVGSHCQNSE